MNRFSIVISFLILSLPVLGQKVEVTPQDDSVAVGDQTVIDVRVYPEGKSIQWPSLSNNLTKSIEIIDYKDIDTIEIGKKTLLKRSIIVTPWDTGYQEIPVLSFGIENKDSLFSEAQIIKVKSVLLKSKVEIHKDKKLMTYEGAALWEEKKFDWFWTLIISGTILTLTFLAFLIFKLLKNRKKPTVVEKTFDELLEEMLNELDAIDKSETFDAKYFFGLVSYTLRFFLEERTIPNATSLSSSGLIQEVNNTLIKQEEKEKTTGILQLCDEVKFMPKTNFENKKNQILIDLKTIINSNSFKPIIEE